MRRLKLVMEALHTQSEQEIEILAKITEPDGLAQAFAIEKQIQAQIRTKLGAIRVRKTTTFAESGEENDDAIEDNTIEVILEKNRSGARGTVKLIFQKEYNKFSSIAQFEER